MSQDMMQALSGSSLLSLSVGTLPAVKAGMTLDANPFASQLALMTGTDAAASGMLAPAPVAPMAAEGAFAATLAEITEPVLAAAPTGEAPAPVMPETPALKAVPVMVAPEAPVVTALPEAPVVAALPEEASTSQLIEAALSGAATLNEAAEVAAAPRAPEMPRATPALQAVDAPRAGPVRTIEVAEIEAPVSPVQPEAKPVTAAQPLPRAANVPHLKNLIRADAPMPIRAQIASETDSDSADAVGSDENRVQTRPEAVEDALPVDAATIQLVAAALTPAPAPVPVRQAPVTDLGTTRALTEVSPEAPRQAPVDQTVATKPGRTQPAIAPTYPHGLASAAPQTAPMPVQAAAPVAQAQPANYAAPIATAPAAPIATQDQRAPALRPGIVAAPIEAEATLVVDAEPVAATPAAAPAAVVEPPHLRMARLAQASVDAAQPGPVQPIPQATASLVPTEAAPVANTVDGSTVRNVQAPAAAIAPAPVAAAPQSRPSIVPVQPAAPADPAGPMGAPQAINAAQAPVAQSSEAIAAPIVATPSATPQSPASDIRNAAPVQAQVQVPTQPQPQQPVAPAPVADAAAAAKMAMTAPGQTQATTPATRPAVTSATARAPIGAATRRTLDDAVASPRPVEARSAFVDLANPAIQPEASSLMIEPLPSLSTEAIPPAWAAALNAVNQPVQQTAGLAAPLAAAQPQVPMHNLAFDAGFVAGIESQIAKLANGEQMVKIQVMPEHLGRIDIEMLAGPDRDQVRIVTEHDAVRDTLVSSQHRLEQDLRSNGQRNAEVTVELRQQSPGTQNGSAQQQQQRGQSGAESASARDAAQRSSAAEQNNDANPAPRRPRGNVRYA